MRRVLLALSILLSSVACVIDTVPLPEGTKGGIGVDQPGGDPAGEDWGGAGDAYPPSNGGEGSTLGGEPGVVDGDGSGADGDATGCSADGVSCD